jgi:hypothetical protein
MPRAFLQTTFASRMAQETRNDSTETAWTYHEHRRLLDDEMMAICRIYAEVELADLPVHEGERAQKWLMIMHRNIERAREHIGMRIRDAGEWGAPPSLPERRYSYRQRDRRRAVRATLQAEAAATRARLQAARARGMPGKPQPAAKADTETEETRSGQPRDPTCPRTPSGTKIGLVDSTSESDASDPGGMPQLLRGSTGSVAYPPRLPRALPHQSGKEEVRSGVAAQEVEELPAAHTRKENPGLGLPQVAGTNSSSKETGDDDAKAPVPDQPPGGSDELARELANTMSTIASLVIKASGRSVSNGGWLYFNGESKDYCAFRAKCRLFQETYLKATPTVALVKMFKEWNLAEDVACRIEGAKDMPTAWRTLDSIYGAPLALTIDQTPDAGGMPEHAEVESGVGSDAGLTSEKEPAPMCARKATAHRIVDTGAARPAVEAATSPQGKHVFINTPHGIRSLRRLWVPGEEPEHTVVSKEVAQSYSMRANGRRQATWIMGPRGVTVGIDTDYEMFLLADDLPGRTKRVTVYAVDSVEKYCGLPPGVTGEYEIQLGRDHVELLEQLRKEQPYRTGARLSERWGETIWRLAAYATCG